MEDHQLCFLFVFRLAQDKSGVVAELYHCAHRLSSSPEATVWGSLVPKYLLQIPFRNVQSTSAILTLPGQEFLSRSSSQVGTSVILTMTTPWSINLMRLFLLQWVHQSYFQKCQQQCPCQPRARICQHRASRVRLDGPVAPVSVRCSCNSTYSRRLQILPLSLY